MVNNQYINNPAIKRLLQKQLRSTKPGHKNIHKGVKYWDVEDDFVFQLPDEVDAQPETAATGS